MSDDWTLLARESAADARMYADKSSGRGSARAMQ